MTSVVSQRRDPAYLNRDAASYLDGVAEQLREVKAAIRAVLAPRPGQRLLDVGCGAGPDVLALAAAVGPDGIVAGIDTSDELIAQARRRATGPVEFQVADAAALPFPDGHFHGTRAERVLQHVAAPEVAVAEMARVTAPGGRVVLAEPDHDMWAVTAADVASTRALLHWWVDHIRNPWMGRQLPAQLRAAGLTEVRVRVLPIVLYGLAAADAVIGLGQLATAAGAAGVVAVQRCEAWQADLTRRDADGELLTLGAIVVAHGTMPTGL